MHGPRCEHCHHYNSIYAQFCEECEAPLRRVNPDAGDVTSPTLAVFRKHFTLIGILVLVTTVPEVLISYAVVDFAAYGMVIPGAGADFTSVQGMLISLIYVLTVYVYLGLLREHQSGSGADAFVQVPTASVG